MKNNIYYILFLIITFIIGMIISILLFRTPIFSFCHVLMYRGILIILFTGLLMIITLCLLLHFLHKKTDKVIFFNGRDIFNVFIIYVCVHLMFFTLVPVSVERSVSVFTLSQMEEKSNDTFTKEEAENIFINKYMGTNDAFGKRFDEQIVTGSIKKNIDGSYTLTDRGHFIVSLFRIIGKLYNANCKNLY